MSPEPPKYKIGILTIDSKIQYENLNYRWAVIMQMERRLAYRLLPSPKKLNLLEPVISFYWNKNYCN
jgi:hypothetical protein